MQMTKKDRCPVCNDFVYEILWRGNDFIGVSICRNCLWQEKNISEPDNDLILKVVNKLNDISLDEARVILTIFNNDLICTPYDVTTENTCKRLCGKGYLDLTIDTGNLNFSISEKYGQ